MATNITEKYKLHIIYKYVPTELNPADYITRGLTFKKFQENIGVWMHGPSWLNQTNVTWPERPLQCLNEENKKIVQTNAVNLQQTEESVIDMNRFSTYKKVHNVTSLVFKFLKIKTKNLSSTETPEDCATNYLLKTMQSQCFKTELDYLKDPSKKQVPQLVSKLNLYLDESNIIRSQGRIVKCEKIQVQTHSPILLGRKHHLTRLLIEFYHKRVSHLGTGTTLAKIRESGYWIPQARHVINKTLRKCFVCKKLNTMPYPYPKETALPKPRVNLTTPFRDTGTDFAGPIMVDFNGAEAKMYILIFTLCLATRGIHLELIPDMSTEQFVLAFIRFTTLYGVPATVYSDQAKSFKKGSNLFNSYFQSSEFNQKFGLFKIRHITIPTYSPWVGSAWERMLRVVKSCLRKSIQKDKISYFPLLTVLSDIKQSINSRPLTYQESDDGFTAVTPNNFIHALSPPEMLLCEPNSKIKLSKAAQKDNLIRTLKERDQMLNRFSEIWHTSYLLSLRERNNDLLQPDFKNKIKLDDVVLIRNPTKTRPFWSLGRVIRVFPGHDGLIRSAMIQRGDKTTRQYSIKHLYPLEISASETADEAVTSAINNRDAAQADSGDDDVASVLSTADVPDTAYPVQSPPQSPQQATRKSKRIADRGRKTVLRGSDDPYLYY